MVVSILLPQNSLYLCLLSSTSTIPSYRPRVMLRSSPHRLLNQACRFSSETNSIIRSLNIFSKKTFPHTSDPTVFPSRTSFAVRASHSQYFPLSPPHSYPATASSPSDSEPQSGEPFPHLKSRVNTHVETQDIWFDPLLAAVTPFSEPKFEPIHPSKRKPKQPKASVSASAVIPAETFAVIERRRIRELKRSETAVKLAARDARVQATLAEIDLAADSYSAADCLLSLQASLDDQIDAQLSGYPAPPLPSIAYQRRSPARRGRGGARDAQAGNEGGEEKVETREGKRQLSIGQLLKESILRDMVPADRDVAGGEEEVSAGRDMTGSREPPPDSEGAPGGTSAGVRSGPSAWGAEVPGGAQGVGSGAGSSYVRVTGPLAHVACRPFMVKRGKKLPENWDGAGGTVALIDKPKGWTSFAVCGRLRHLLKIKKVGHAGTLDPMATGLLVVCIGKATKLADSYQAMTKVYSGTLRLGEATPSYDAETPVCERLPWEHISDDALTEVTSLFLGDIMQTPPMFSAIKVKGEKMYDKARKGEHVDLPPRPVAINELTLTRNADDRQNVDFYVICSKGTYIRSLAYDLARELGSCAHLVALRREMIGELSVQGAFPIAELMELYADEQSALTSFNGGMWASKKSSDLEENV